MLRAHIFLFLLWTLFQATYCNKNEKGKNDKIEPENFKKLVHQAQGKKLVTLKEPINAVSMEIHRNRLYILDEMVVHIYSMKDFNYMGKFGGRGNGPGEFNSNYWPMTPIQMKFMDGAIILFRMFKIAMFSLDGQVTGEKRIPFLTADILALKENYLINKIRLANQYLPGKEKIHRKFLQLYSREFKELKTLNTIEYTMPDPNKVGYQIFRPAQTYTCYDNGRIYLYHDQYLPRILVFNDHGLPLDPIILDIPKLEISASFKKEVVSWVLSVPTLKGFKDTTILFPNLLPAFRYFMVKNNKIIGQTYEKYNSLTKFIIYDIGTKLLTTVYLPTAEREKVSFTNNKIFAFTGTHYYYLVDNYDDETWELWAMEFNL